MLNNYITMTQIGVFFGKTSHQVGHKLKELGLRTQDGKPSKKAHSDGFVARQFAKDKPEVYVWAWHQLLTCAALEEAGWERK